jgi:hypothetical protein
LAYPYREAERGESGIQEISYRLSTLAGGDLSMRDFKKISAEIRKNSATIQKQIEM